MALTHAAVFGNHSVGTAILLRDRECDAYSGLPWSVAGPLVFACNGVDDGLHHLDAVVGVSHDGDSATGGGEGDEIGLKALFAPAVSEAISFARGIHEPAEADFF